ncbi:methylthioribose-1-phosphate isomerase [Monosporozyma unispora]|nr:S-methyl-5-thioribose-1-phosphate isomerase [Kazachstania unispora]
MSLEAIRFDRSNQKDVSVEVLDQLLLPYTTKYIPIHTINDGYGVIKSMQVRGAPAIAIVGALSVLLETQLMLNKPFADTQYFYDVSSWASFQSRFLERLNFLLSSRPTAVNLSNSLKVITKLVGESDNIAILNDKVFQYTCQLIDEDLSNNIKMGDNGANYLLNSFTTEGFEDDFAVLTICNTGSLATSGYGTALGVIRSLWKDSESKSERKFKKAKTDSKQPHKAKMTHVYPLETRPYNQGSRLTAYELTQEGIPATLITDSSIAYRIKTSPIPIKAAFVGADRIVRNGDTANKIGTYQLAIICKQFGIKFFVVAPRTTIDNVTKTGDGIVVEERKANEFKLVTGTLVDSVTEEPVLNEKNEPISTKVGVAPPEIDVWNPAFDITTYDLIDGIVTEEGVFSKDTNGQFNLESLF